MNTSGMLIAVVVPQLVYTLLAAVVAKLLGWFAMLSRTRILASCLCAGLVAGVLAIRLWPNDSVILVNLPGVVLGDLAYDVSIRLLGDPSSPQAHYTIPWLLRVPQVYGLVSVVLWGVAGGVVQLLVNRKSQ